MKKKISLSLLLGMVLFLAAIITTSNFQTDYHVGDKFGWPLVFFTAFNNHEVVTDQSFSILNLIVDLTFCMLCSIGIYTLFSKLKIERKSS
jgi:hypothetical protein